MEVETAGMLAGRARVGRALDDMTGVVFIFSLLSERWLLQD
jgi:hypothetical protein